MELLDTDLVLGPDGHLTDVGASVLADGQGALLPPAVARHADGCTTCLARVGDAALASLEAHDLLGSLEGVAPAPLELAAAARSDVGEPVALAATEPAVQAAPLPWWAVVAAMTLALVGVGMSTSVREAAAVGVSVAGAVPVLARTLLVGLAAPEFSMGFERATLAGAATLWVAGMALGWLATRGRRSRQEEGS